VLLHGGGDRWQCFAPLYPSLVERWHVYALDLRGHGKSGRVPGAYRPEDYVEDVTAFLCELDEPAILLGHSLGAWVALLTAVELEEGVRATILGDPPLNLERFVAKESSKGQIRFWRTLRRLTGAGLDEPEFASALAELPIHTPRQDQPMRYGDLPGVDQAHLMDWARTLRQVDPDVIQYHAEGRIGTYVEHMDIDRALQRISCPVLLIQGDPSRGGRISDSDVERALALLPNGRHVRLEGLGHGLGLSERKAGPLLRAINEFCDAL
jgi:pimeloyl-ACP methyl ester carboxylesterase